MILLKGLRFIIQGQEYMYGQTICNLLISTIMSW